MPSSVMPPPILHLDQGLTLVPLCHPWHPKLFPCLFLSGKESWSSLREEVRYAWVVRPSAPTQKEVSGRLWEEIAKGAILGNPEKGEGKSGSRGASLSLAVGGTPTPWRSSRPASLSPQIRLSGGRSRFEGRVEVAVAARGNRARQWGLICGEGWGTLEAMVACRQLGLGFANHGLQVGHCCQGQAWLLGGRLGITSWGVPHAGWCTLGEGIHPWA